MVTRPDDVIVETERLWLCRIDPKRDFARWAETMADPQTVRYIGGAVMSPEQAWRNMAMVAGHWQFRGYGFFSAIEKVSGDHVGRVGPWYPQGWPAPEIGWTLHPAAQGKGYATEAGRACIDYVRDCLGWDGVIHLIEDGNTASIRVAEKLGSRRQDVFDAGIPGLSTDRCWIYGQTF